MAQEDAIYPVGVEAEDDGIYLAWVTDKYSIDF
jgi:hypothetical protein